MKQSQNQIQTLQVLYELAMSIGTSLDLHQMLKTSLQAFLKKLNCAAGGIYQYQSVDGIFHFEAIQNVPLQTDRTDIFQAALANLPYASSAQEMGQFLEALPLFDVCEDGSYYVLDIPGFGVMVLIKNDEAIDPFLMESLRPLQEKLAAAATACLSESALRKAQEHSQVILESITIPLLISRLSDGRIMYANQLLADMIRSSLEDLIGEVTPDFYVDQSDRQVLLTKLREQGSLSNYELHLKRNDGKLIWVLISIRVFEYQDEMALITTFSDITERKQTMQELEESRFRNQLILESVTLPLLISRVEDGAVIFANERIVEMMDMELEDVLGKQTPDFYYNPDDRLEVLRGIREHGGIDNKELPILRNGEIIWVLLSNRLVQYEGDDAIITTLVDITGRKNAEEALAKRASELETVAQVSASASTILETDKLLQEVVDLTKERFNLYHAHIYLLDEVNDTLVLTAGAGDIGRQMVAEERTIPLAKEQSLVAQAARTKMGVIENDVLKNPAFLPHPLLPETKAEMAVPMLVGERVVGVLDIQASEVNCFTQQDVIVNTTLAAQIGVALENAASFEQAQTSLAETRALLDIARETSRTLELEDMLDNVLNQVLAATNFSIGLISTEIPGTRELQIRSHRLPDAFLHMLQEKGLEGTLCDLVYRREEPIIVLDLNDDAPVDVTALVNMGYQSYQGVPLEAQGRIFGTICIFNDELLASEQINRRFLQAVGQQVGVAIQNAALFEQTQTALAEAKRSHEILHERETLMRTIIDATPDWIFVKDRDHCYQLVNQGYAHSFNMLPEAFIGKNDLDIGFPEDIVKGNPEKGIQGFWPDDNEVMASGEVKYVDIEPAVVDGEEIFLSTVKTPLRDANGNVTGLVGFVHDITERVKAEEAATTHAQRLSQLNEMNTVLGQADSYDDIYHAVGLYVQQILGGDRASLALVDPDGKTFTVSGLSGEKGVIPLDTHLPIEGTAVGKAIITGRLLQFPQDGTMDDYVDTSNMAQAGMQSTLCSPVVVDGKVIGTINIADKTPDAFGRQEISLMRQVTNLVSSTLQERQTSEEMKLSEARFRDVAAASKDWVWEIDHDGQYTYCSDAIFEILGYTPEELIGKEAAIHQTPEETQRVKAIYAGITAANQPWTDFEAFYLTKDGQEVIALTSAVPVFNQAGERVGYRGVNRDITERKRFEEALREEQQRTATILESITTPMVITKVTDGTVAYLNQPIADLMRVSREETIGRVAPDFYYDPADRQAYIQTLRTSGQVDNYELRLKRDDGKPFWALMSGRILTMDGVPSVVTSIIDITERQEASQALERQANELAAVAEVSTVAAQIRETEELLQAVVDLTKERFGLYHSHIYLLDAGKNVLVMTVGAGAVGRELTAQGHQIDLNATPSLVAQAARTQEAVVVNDVRSDPHWLPNKLLPDTLAEMAVPMVVSGQVIGVLDLQSSEANRFTEQDKRIKTTLATQTAVALQNARSYQQAQMAVAEMNELTRRLTREGWQEYLQQQTPEKTGFMFDASEFDAVQPVSDVSELVLDENGAAPAHVQPINIRGEEIGRLVIIPEGADEEIDQETLVILNAITEQLGARIDNIRLADQTQTALAETETQAQRLACLNDMSTALGQAGDLRNIYNIAVAQTPNVIDADRVSLALLDDSRENFEIASVWGEVAELPVGGHLPAADSPMWQAMQERRITEGTTQGDILSALFIPLYVSGRAIGTLNVGSKLNSAFDDRDENLLRQVAAIVSSNIENMRFLMNEQARAQREQMLRQISQRIRSSADVETIMRTAVQEIGRTLGRKTYIYLGDDREA